MKILLSCFLIVPVLALVILWVMPETRTPGVRDTAPSSQPAPIAASSFRTTETATTIPPESPTPTSETASTPLQPESSSPFPAAAQRSAVPPQPQRPQHPPVTVSHSSTRPQPPAKRSNAPSSTSNSGGTTFLSSGGTGTSQPTTTTAAEAGAQVLEVEPGVVLPAALVDDPERSETPAMAAAREAAVEQYLNTVDPAGSQATSGATEATDPEAARRSADAIYRALYGHEAANRAGMQAVMEARGGM